MLRDEIQPYLEVVLLYPDGCETYPGQWSGLIAELLRHPEDRPLWMRHPITLIHDATRQPWGGRKPAVYVSLGEVLG
jgi:hypothetical protein